MNDNQYHSFVRYLKQGPPIEWRPGQVTYTELVKHFNFAPNDSSQFPKYGEFWFQDLFFWFDANGVLASLELLTIPFEDHVHLPKLLNIEWTEFAHNLTPEIFEELVVKERIPCLKATKIVDEDIYPPIYCLDHLGIMPRFQEEPPYGLVRIDMCLLRSFPPLLGYQEIWPKPYSADSSTYLLSTSK